MGVAPELGEVAEQGAVPDQDQLPVLPVAGGARPARNIDDVPDGVRGNGVGPEPADRAQPEQELDLRLARRGAQGEPTLGSQSSRRDS
jgi:hypothetical protein